MSESEPSNEFECTEPSAIRRYYDYVNEAKGNAATAVMAIADLLDNLPVSLDVPLGAIFDAEEYETMFAVDERVANETLLLLPFMHIGRPLERSDCSLQELHAWHDEAVRMLLVHTKQDHDLICLTYDDGNPQHFMCDESTVCPQRFVSRYLADDAWIPDFTKKRYQDNPARARAIAIDKLDIGQKYGSVLPVFYDTTLHTYEEAYDAYIDEVVQSSMQDIDYFNRK